MAEIDTTKKEGSTESAQKAETTETMEGTETTNAAETTKATNAAEVAEDTETVKATETAEAEEGTEASQNNSVPDVIEIIVNTDGRKSYDWKSRYPKEAHDEMLGEAIYIGAVLALSLSGMFLNWCGVFNCCVGEDPARASALRGIVFYFFSGLMGGTIFGLKYFYRVIARGYWSQDRKYWRIFSPWISACIALVIGCMVVAGYINAAQAPSTATGICIGFLAGYFADDAVGKMSDVAKALFGSSSKTK